MRLALRPWPSLLALALFGLATAVSAAELQFNLGQFTFGGLPPGLVSLKTGDGQPGEWQVLDDIMPSSATPLFSNGFSPTLKHPVLARTATNAASNQCSLLLYTNESMGDFTLTTRVKILSGSLAPEAGFAFRATDLSNYYVLRASAQGNLLWYRVVDGVRYESQGVGVQLPIPRDTWAELKVECVGNRIRCFWNGNLAIPPARAGAPTNDLAIIDNTFAVGQIGFWTAADTTAYFSDVHVTYVRRVPLIQTVILEVMKKNPRLLGLKVYELKSGPSPVLVADGKNQDLGSPGGKTEETVIRDGTVMYLKQKDSVELTMPLRDRNGDIVAALKTTMTTFKGETTDTSYARASTIKDEVEEKINTLQDIND